MVRFFVAMEGKDGVSSSGWEAELDEEPPEGAEFVCTDGTPAVAKYVVPPTEPGLPSTIWAKRLSR